MTNNFEKNISNEGELRKEYGKDVQIRLKIIRHGERTKEGELTDYGREITRQKAEESSLENEEFHAVKAYGSQAGPKNKEDMARAMETADIYAEEVGGEKQFETREDALLSYETIQTPAPYNHKEIYNANLPDNFEQLSNTEKSEVAKRAQSATVNYFLSLDNPEAQKYKEEVAGAFANIILHREKMSLRLNKGSKVLMIAGTHGPMPEPLLQQALIRKGEDGGEIRGFKDINEIGGPLQASDSFDVLIERDNDGKLKKLRVEFDDSQRLQGTEMYLDSEKLEELAKHYRELYQKKEKE